MIESYLVLALDEDGNYYQQKITKAVNSSLSTGPREYVTIKGAPLKWLPVIFPSDEELQAGKLPMELGFLSPICDLALARYRMSAEYKETIRNLPPTTYTKGWTANDHDTFKQINNGRDFIITGSGSVNNLPNDVTVEIVGVNAQVEPYERYFERSKSEARSMGAVIPESSEAAKTATEVSNAAAEQNAVLSMVADSLEAVYTRLCLYCGMFEGLWSQDAIEQNMDKVSIALPRDFASIKISAQDRAAILNEHLGGLITKEEALLQLEAGGVLATNAETILNAYDSGE
jgi:phospholipid N-methyltransferase